MSNDHKHSHLWPGVPLALCSAALFGASAPISKLLLNSIDPFVLAGLLYFGAGFGLAIYRFVFSGSSNEASLSRKDWPWLALATLSGGVIGPVLLLFGLSRIDASSGALLLNLEALATMGIAWLIFKENADRRLLIGAAAILAGAMILSWNGHGLTLNIGALWIASACLAWGIDNNLTRNIAASDPVMIAMIKGLAAGSVNLTIAFWLASPMPPATFIVAAAFVGFLCVGVSLVFFIHALRHLGTARTGAYFSLAPFIGALLSIALLADQVSIKLVLAGVLMGFGLWLHLTESHLHDHEHEAIEHDHAHTHDQHHEHKHNELVNEPHSHSHKHTPMRHAHPHYPDMHHRHTH